MALNDLPKALTLGYTNSWLDTLTGVPDNVHPLTTAELAEMDLDIVPGTTLTAKEAA